MAAPYDLPELAPICPIDSDSSCFRNVLIKEHVSLLPSFVGKLSQGITEYLSSKILKYSSQFGGVLLCYSRPTLMNQEGRIMDEQPHIHFDVTYSATLFKPVLGSVLCGRVNKVGVDHVGCLLYDCFNVTVVSKTMNHRNFPSGFEEESTICFTVTLLDITGDLLSLIGEYLEV